MERKIIDVDWRPVTAAEEKQDKPNRAEWENNRTTANLLMASMAFFAWAVSTAVFVQVIVPGL